MCYQVGSISRDVKVIMGPESILCVAFFAYGICASSLIENVADLVGSYAKVARWGATNGEQEERSSGQKLWTQR